MKNKIAIASAFLAAASFSSAEIVINDFLSFEGFVDMSYGHFDTETDNRGSESDNNFAIDQVEIDWLFDFDPVTAQIDLQYEDGVDDRDDDDIVEQAFVTYHLDGDFEGGAITAGRYASMLGFEAFEPTGLYQYSLAYDINGAQADGSNDLSIIPGYAQGVKYTHETDNTFFGISVQDEAFDYDSDRLGGDDDSSWATEVAGAYSMDNGLSFFLGGAYEDGDIGDTWIINLYSTLETGAWLFAAEVNYGETESGAFEYAGPGPFRAIVEAEVLQALIMANMAYSDEASVTGRISYNDFDSDNEDFGAEYIKYTLAHNYAFTDNLLLVNELSYIDGSRGFGEDVDYETLVLAVELLFSF